MIVTQLAGGLGNQMFQYAAARGYQRKKNERIILDTRLLTDLEVDIDIEKIHQRPYSLNIFKNIKAELISQELIYILNKSGFQYQIKNKLFHQFTQTIVQDVMNPIALKSVRKKNVVLAGYFQSEEYFYQLKDVIRQDFAFSQLDDGNNMIKSAILNSENAVSVHVRRGDYLSTANRNTFTSVNLEYYKNAFAELKRCLSIEHLKPFIFTDDLEWVKQNFDGTGLNLHFVQGNYGMDSWKDMYLMSCCQHHIIANSSFSWWGAWLGNPAGITLAPYHWFLPSTYNYDIKHIIPPSWKVVDYSL